MIRIYDKFDTDFAGNGLRVIRPIDCTVRETLNGMYKLDMVCGLDDAAADAIALGNVIVAPVPRAETPPVDIDEESKTSARIYAVDNGGKRVPLRSGAGSKKPVVGRYTDGTEVVLLKKKSSSWFRVIAPDGAGGYMPSGKLRYVRTETVPARKSVVLAPRQVRDQPFRICEIEPGLDTVTVHARHISYDLSDNRIKPVYATRKTRQDAADMIMAACVDKDHEFSLYCEGDGIATMQLTEMVSPLAAILGSEGLIEAYGGELMRDWYDLYIPDSIGEDRGVHIDYGRNLESLAGKVHTDSMATRIIPIGVDKDGKDIYLPETYVDSPRAAEWPHPLIVELRVPDADTGIMSANEAYAMMRKAAQDQIAAGCDQPEATFSVGYVDLSETEAFARYRDLQRLCLGDPVRCNLGPMGLRTVQRMTGYIFDCLTGRYTGITLGATGDTIASVGISPKQLPAGGIGPSKLATGAADARVLGEAAVRSIHIDSAAIQRAHIAQACIDALNALSLDAVTAKIKSLTAEDITAGTTITNTLAAAFAHLFELVAEQIRAGSVTADTLSAVMASLVSASVGTLDVGYAHVKDLDADEAIITDGVAGALLIERLVATSAMMASATLGELIVRGEDGKYYEVAIQAGGTIGTREVTVSEGEIAAGQTAAGRKIVETEADIQSLNATDVRAQSAVIASIFTSALTAGRITAGQALISSLTAPELYVTAVKALGDTIDISANRSISLQLGAANDVRRWIGFDNASGMTVRKPAYIDDDGVAHDRSKWYTVTDEVGFHVFHEDVAGPVGSFHEEQLDVRNLQIGEIVARRTATGGWVWAE